MKAIAPLTILMILVTPGLLSGQNDSRFDPKVVATNMQKRFEDCPRREVVAQFERKHHKHVWQKQAWGPPTDVFVDVKANDSVLFPYMMIVEFSLAHAFGPERQDRSTAEHDTDLSENSTLASLLKSKYRNVYLLSKEGTRLKSRDVLGPNLEGKSNSWTQRPAWSDACWDQITAD